MHFLFLRDKEMIIEAARECGKNNVSPTHSPCPPHHCFTTERRLPRAPLSRGSQNIPGDSADPILDRTPGDHDDTSAVRLALLGATHFVPGPTRPSQLPREPWDSPASPQKQRQVARPRSLCDSPGLFHSDVNAFSSPVTLTMYMTLRSQGRG